ncbi:PTS trehalose transporter subunit IIBC [Vagococcus elongatus]|uniref:PTS trehalose transporter subunit IIBC n=1 Tax=Vagococcus elongatus TaxID=180344 RepID=A0A430B489_9ENTE|nr:PTS trehalose transporter subunit IIBC [Vagococcus elongatus]RSU15144.1 PTS trehalose transporter subunit IIBC [Vagococcus elongatus]
MSNLKKDVTKIIHAVGGNDNISAVTHCVTRLRLVLEDENVINIPELESIDIVKGSFSANGQFQVIIGPGLITKVYDEFLTQTNQRILSKQEVKEQASEKLNIFQKLIKYLGDIFIPILPAIVASGLLMGVNNILSNPGIFYEQPFLEVHPGWAGIANMINLIANTSFAFLPALVGWSAVKKFGGNPLLGIVLGLILINPQLMPGAQYARTPEEVSYWNLFGWKVAQIGYQGQVIPVLFSSFILAKTEIFLTKKIPDMLQMILVSPITLLFTGFITFTIIGPITMILSNIITDSILKLFEISPILAGGVFGSLVSPLVVTGMHHLFLGVNLQMIGSLGYATLWPIQVMASLAQGAAALMMFFIIKNKKEKGVALTASISAWLGITEPAIFGINLRYKYPFLAAMVGAGVAGAITASADVKATSIGISGLPAPLSIMPNYWMIYFISMALSISITMGLTYLFSIKNLSFKKIDSPSKEPLRQTN